MTPRPVTEYITSRTDTSVEVIPQPKESPTAAIKPKNGTSTPARVAACCARELRGTGTES